MAYGVLERPLFTVRDIPLESGEWQYSNEYVHNSCGQHAFMHPDNNRVWACKHCSLITESPAIYFRHV